MGNLYFWTKDLSGYRMTIEEPVRPYALNYLAASGVFDKLVLELKGDVSIKVEGADLLKLADAVAPKSME